jgi:glycosyltransferase involved in cell wall biosynthesis
MTNQRLPISVIILTYNEEANIEACLQSVCEWAGEIFVVDSYSTDRTIEIVQRYTDKVVQHPFENYSQQRNWAQEHLPLTYEWVFHIDAGEKVSHTLAQSIKAFFAGSQHQKVDGLLIIRLGVFLGKPMRHGGVYPVYHLRIFRRSKGRCEDRLYDQHFIIDGVTTRLEGELIDPMASDLTNWTLRHERWAAAEAQEQMLLGTKDERSQVVARVTGTPIEQRRWLRNRVYGRAPLFVRAFGYFIYRYFLRFGFLDGTEGLIFHFLQGCWYRFYIDAKIYEARKLATDPTSHRSAAESANADT